MQPTQLEQLKADADNGQALAQFRYGLWLLQQDQVELALRYLHQAAEQNMHKATELIGTVILTGHGVKADPGLAFGYFRRAALGGDAQALYRCAELMFNGKGEVNADRAGALDCLRESAKLGYPLALRTVAFLMLSQATDADRACAKTCLALAALSGDPFAQHSYALLVQNAGSADAGYWFAAAAERGLLRAQAQLIKYPGYTTPVLPQPQQVQQWLLEVRLHLDNYNFVTVPSAANFVQLSQLPLVETAGSLLSELECDYLIHLSQPHLQTARVVTVAEQQPLDTYRTGDTANFAPVIDILVDWLTERICNVVAMPVSHAEPTAIIRYQPGQQYFEHGDYLPEGSALTTQELGGQRIKTVLVYLNQDFQGGRTVFPAVDLKVTPVTGTALVFANADDSGKPVEASRHAGEVVIAGQKWLLSIWFRQYPRQIENSAG